MDLLKTMLKFKQYNLILMTAKYIEHRTCIPQVNLLTRFASYFICYFFSFWVNLFLIKLPPLKGCDSSLLKYSLAGSKIMILQHFSSSLIFFCWLIFLASHRRPGQIVRDQNFRIGLELEKVFWGQFDTIFYICNLTTHLINREQERKDKQVLKIQVIQGL
jgi:hypothetical protein